MKVQSRSINQYQYDNTLNYLGGTINGVPNPIKEAISKAISSTNLEGRDKIIIPRAFLKGAEFSSRISFNESISNLSITQWRQLAENALMNVDPKDIKTKTFLEYFIAYLK